MKKPEFHTEAGIARREAEGRGKGDGKDYFSWILVPEFPSRGFRTMLYSPKLGRVVHLFSLLELFVFLYAESHPNFLEIKENFPLQRSRTQLIAAQIRPEIRHPEVGGVNIVMTTDLLITAEIKPGLLFKFAWSTKYQDELRNPRPVEKLQIEQLYHEGAAAEDPAKYSIMTEEKLPMVMIQNIRYVRGTTRPGAMLGYSPEQIDLVDGFMRPRLTETALSKLSAECGRALGFDGAQSALRVARYLIASARWPVDMMSKIDPFQPLKLRTSP